jgi:hypothetical protein
MTATPGGRSEIGSVSVGVRADTTQLQAGMTEAKQVTEQAGASMSASVERVTQKTTGLGQAMRGALSPITRVTGALAAATGVAYVFARGIQFVESVLKSGAARAEEFSNALNFDASNVQNNVRQLAGEVAKLEAQLTDAQGIFGFLKALRSGTTPGALAEQIKELRRLEQSLRGQSRGQDNSAKREKERLDSVKEIEGIERKITADRRALMDPEAARAEEMADLVKQLESLKGKSADPAWATRLEDAIKQLFANESHRHQQAAEAMANKMRDVLRDMGKEMARDIGAAVERTLVPIAVDVRQLPHKADALNRNLGRTTGIYTQSTGTTRR